MMNVVGSPGTWSSLALRLSQCLCAAASITAMVNTNGFSSYSTFMHLILSMSFQFLWSFFCACADIYSLMTKADLHHPVLVVPVVILDWLTAIISSGIVSACASVAILFYRDIHFCRAYPLLSCHQYVLSVVLASMAWSLIAASSVSTFWLLASMF